jgi:YD repeat-containing protein
MDAYDGAANYTHDNTDQLLTADHTSQTDENYSYDPSGNRTMSGYVTGLGNRLLSAGVYT